MMNSRIYLSGGMQHAAELGAGWRESCSTRLLSMGYQPLNITELDVAYSQLHGQLYRSADDSDDVVLSRKSNIRSHFVNADIQLIRQYTEALIVYYDDSVRLGAGTISEIHEAYMLGLPIFLVNSYPTLDEVPGWMQAETTKIFSSFEDLYAYLAALPQGILNKDIYGNRRSGMHYLCSLCGDVEEKHTTHFVSKVSPLYCKRCVDIVKTTHEQHPDRFQFFLDYLPFLGN